MGRFVSIYAEKHLGTCSMWCCWMPRITLAINKLKSDMIYIFWSAVSWKENVTTTKKDHKAEKGQEKKWGGGQRKPTLKKCYFPALHYILSALVFLTHHKGQSWEHCSVHHFAVNCFCVAITLKWTLQTQEMSLHMLLRIMLAFFFSHSSILIFKLILAESCSTLSFPLPLAGEYNNSVILLTVESYGIWDCYWRALFYKVKLRLGGLLFKFSSSLQNNYPKTQKKLKTHTSNQNDYVISQRATLQNNKFLCIF